MPELTTKERALNVATSLLQTNGFNAFSFQHVADALGIKKPSMFEHFKSKEDLGLEVIRNYQTQAIKWREKVSELRPDERIAALFEVFSSFVCDGGKLCPIGALGADFNALPKKMQKELSKAYAGQAEWLKTVIAEGQKKKIFRNDMPAEALAQIVHSAGLGAQKAARLSGNEAHMRKIRDSVLKLIERD